MQRTTMHGTTTKAWDDRWDDQSMHGTTIQHGTTIHGKTGQAFIQDFFWGGGNCLYDL